MNKTVNNRTVPYPMHSTANHLEMMITRRDYTAEIENLDRQFGIIINKFRELGQYDNTIFCASSDHGEMLGDFNRWGKSRPWVASSNVPFVCMGPGIIKNNIINTYVTNMDIAGTVLDYANTKKLNNMTTMSLKPFLDGIWNDNNHEYRKYVSSGLGHWRMVIVDYNSSVTWKYIYCKTKCPSRNFEAKKNLKNNLSELLFNIKQDMYELINVADQYPNIAKQLKSLLPPNFCKHE